MAVQELVELAIEAGFGGGGGGATGSGLDEVTDAARAVGGKFGDGAVGKYELQPLNRCGNATVALAEIIAGRVGNQATDGGVRVVGDRQPKTVQAESLIKVAESDAGLNSDQASTQVNFFNAIEAGGGDE